MHLKCVLYLTRRPPEIQNLIYNPAKMTANQISAKKYNKPANISNMFEISNVTNLPATLK